MALSDPEMLLEKSNCRKRCPQILATIAVSIGSFSLGTVLAWTAPALPDLKRRQDFGSLTTHETSWLASLAILGALFSGPVSGICISRLGRRGTMILMSVPFFIGWSLICSGAYFGLKAMLVGRLIAGFCGGSFTVTIPVYVSEIAEDALRGVLGSVMVLMLVSGMLFTVVVGAFTSWFWLSVTCAVVPLILLLSLVFVPESPKYLMLKDDKKKVMAALQWLRGSTDLKQIEHDFQKLRIGTDVEFNGTSSHWRDVWTPSVLKPIIMCLLLFTFQQMGGINGLTMFTVSIFQSAGADVDPHLASIIIGIVQVICVVISIGLVDTTGRKVLLVGADFIMAFSLAVLGWFFYVKETNEGAVPGNLGWIPLLSVISYITAYSIGTGPLPWLLLSECVPQEVKGSGSAVVTSWYWILAFVGAKTFEDMTIYFNWSGCFWIFAVVCCLGGIFTLLYVPETKGKTAEQIQNYFAAHKDSDSQKSDLIVGDANKNETTQLTSGKNHISV